MLSSNVLRLSGSVSRAGCCRPLLIQTQSFSEAAPKKKQAKAKKKAKNVAEEGGRDKNLDLVLASLNAPFRKPQEPSEEQKERRHEIGRNYNIGMFERHNEMNHDLACKAVMKQHAIKMLPRNTKLKEEALKIDDSTIPLWRPMPVHTPPIKDFDPSILIEQEDR